jgi:hypothetical protein
MLYDCVAQSFAQPMAGGAALVGGRRSMPDSLMSPRECDLRA